MVTSERTLLDIDQFETFINLPENRDRAFELIEGEIVEKMVNFQHTVIAGNIIFELKLYLKTNRIGRVGPELSVRSPGDRRNERRPDVSFVSDLSRPVTDASAVEFMPDLAVEVKSPSDTLKGLREKARYFLTNGSKLVWLVIPENQLVEVYTADEESIFGIDGTLSGRDVLPGFTLPVRAIFEDTN